MRLDREEKRHLLATARRAIEGGLKGRIEPPDPTRAPARLQRPGASFVTLRRGGALRGCIGSLEARRPLVLDVFQNALAAAFRDPRFPPLTPEEWPETELEVSVLSRPEPLAYRGYPDLRARVGPGMGLVLEHPRGRATYLPEVWATLPDPDLFLLSLARKAGLPPEVYDDPRTRVLAYTADAFSERDLEEAP